MAEKKITKNMMIEDIVNKYPEVADVMIESGLHCVGCAIAGSESLEDGARSHGLSDEDVDKMVEKMNEVAEKKKE